MRFPARWPGVNRLQWVRASASAATAARRAASSSAPSTDPASSTSVTHEIPSGRSPGAASPATIPAGTPSSCASTSDVPHHLARERRGVEAALAGEDERRALERVAQADHVGDERRPGDEPPTVRGDASSEASRGTGAGQVADFDPPARAGSGRREAPAAARAPAPPRRRRLSAGRRCAPRRRRSSRRRRRRRRPFRGGRSRAPRARRARRRRSPSRRPPRSRAGRPRRALPARARPCRTWLRRAGRCSATSASPLARAISITAVSPRTPHSASTGSPSGPVTRARGVDPPAWGRGRRGCLRRRPRAEAPSRGGRPARPPRRARLPPRPRSGCRGTCRGSRGQGRRASSGAHQLGRPLGDHHGRPVRVAARERRNHRCVDDPAARQHRAAGARASTTASSSSPMRQVPTG